MAVGLAVSNIDKVIGRRGQVIMLDVQFRTTYCIFNATSGLALSDDQICLGSRSGSRNFYFFPELLKIAKMGGSFSAICALRAHFDFSYCLEWGVSEAQRGDMAILQDGWYSTILRFNRLFTYPQLSRYDCGTRASFDCTACLREEQNSKHAPVMRWLQRFDFDSTAVRQPLDCSSTVIKVSVT